MRTPGADSAARRRIKLTWFALTAIVAMGLLHSVFAQPLVSLVTFTNVWKFDASGNDLGTTWRAKDYDDSPWVSGRGLLQAGETSGYPAPFYTTLPPLNGKITYYFRTRFTWQGDPQDPGLQLWATNLVDDGCVLYLNGLEAGRVRVPTNHNYQTLATSGPTIEGQFDVVRLSTAGLQPGDNLLGVEVHQATTTSADVVWGTRLVSQLVQPLTLVRAPTGGKL